MITRFSRWRIFIHHESPDGIPGPTLRAPIFGLGVLIGATLVAVVSSSFGPNPSVETAAFRSLESVAPFHDRHGRCPGQRDLNEIDISALDGQVIEVRMETAEEEALELAVGADNFPRRSPVPQ